MPCVCRQPCLCPVVQESCTIMCHFYFFYCRPSFSARGSSWTTRSVVQVINTKLNWGKWRLCAQNLTPTPRTGRDEGAWSYKFQLWYWKLRFLCFGLNYKFNLHIENYSFIWKKEFLFELQIHFRIQPSTSLNFGGLKPSARAMRRRSLFYLYFLQELVK